MTSPYTYTSSSSSPPPLQHPVPTHPAYIPEPPSTPNSPQGYMRYTSSPAESVPAADYYGSGSGSSHSQPHHNIPSQNQHAHAHASAYAPSQYSGYAPQPGQRMQPLQQHLPQLHPQQHGGPGAELPSGIDLAQFGVNPVTANFGMQLGQSAMAASQEYMQKNFGGHIPVSVLKHHFNVSNSYVIKKLQVLLFPWRRIDAFKRTRRTNEQGIDQWLPPRDDINSPDLYIPVMAFVTYILLAALYSGVQERFHPEILGRVATRALVVVVCEIGLMKLGCYLLNIAGSHQVTDLCAYSGYKFVGVIVTVLFSFTRVNTTVYLLVFAYCMAANGMFMLRSLKHIILPSSEDMPNTIETLANGQKIVRPAFLSSGQRKRRTIFLFACGFMQVIPMGLLVRV